MAPATAHFESDADRQGIWSDAMPIRTTEHLQPEYPEAEITSTAAADRQASCHSKNIPEARREMISGFPIPALATVRPKRDNPSIMQPQADVDRSRFPHFDQRRQLAATFRRSARAQATFHAPSDHEMKYANKLVQLIAGPSGVSMNTDLTFHRSGTGPAGRRAGRVPSLPFRAIHHFRQPAIPDEGR
jgi:ribosomal-protein-alanine N-acetyltransferase